MTIGIDIVAAECHFEHMVCHSVSHGERIGYPVELRGRKFLQKNKTVTDNRDFLSFSHSGELRESLASRGSK